MEKLVQGFVLTGVSGLTYLAYYHPSAYAIISSYLVTVLIVSWIGLAIWDAGSGYAYYKVMKYITKDNFDEATNVVESIQFMTITRGIAFGVLILYLSFLDWLPRILSEQEPP